MLIKLQKLLKLCKTKTFKYVITYYLKEKQMDRKVVKKTLLITLFVVLALYGFLGPNKTSYIGKSVYSSSQICPVLEGICKLSCAENEHAIGSVDCAYGSGS